MHIHSFPFGLVTITHAIHPICGFMYCSISFSCSIRFSSSFSFDLSVMGTRRGRCTTGLLCLSILMWWVASVMHPSLSNTSLYSSSMSFGAVLVLSIICTSFISLHVFNPRMFGTSCLTTLNLTMVYFSSDSHVIHALPHAFSLCPPKVTSFVYISVVGVCWSGRSCVSKWRCIGLRCPA